MRNLFFNKIDFKSFQERNIDPITLENLSKINLIIAPNSRGKSTLCEALRKLIGYKTMTSKRGSKDCIKLTSMNISGIATLNNKDSVENVEFNTNFADPWNNKLDISIERNDRSYILNMEDFINKGEEAFLSTIKNQTTKGLNFDNITTNLSTKEHSLTSVEKDNLHSHERKVKENNEYANQIPEKLEIVHNNAKLIEKNNKKIKSNEEIIAKKREILFDNQIKKLENEINTNFPLEDKLCKLNLQPQIDLSLSNINKTNENIHNLNNEKPEESSIDFDTNKNYNVLLNNLSDINNKNKENIRNIQENESKLKGNSYNENLKIDNTFNINEINGLFEAYEKLNNEKSIIINETNKNEGIKDYLKENSQTYLETQKDISIKNQKDKCQLDSYKELLPLLNEFLNKLPKIKKNRIIITFAIIAIILGIFIFSTTKIGGLIIGLFGLVIVIWALLDKDTYREEIESFRDKIQKKKSELEKEDFAINLDILKYNYNDYISYEKNQEKIKELTNKLNEIKETIKPYLIKYGFDEDASFDYIKNQYEYYKELYDFNGLKNTKEKLSKLEEEYKNEWNNILKDYGKIIYNNENYWTFISNLKTDYDKFFNFKKWNKELEKLNNDLIKEKEKLFKLFNNLNISTKEEYNQVLERLKCYNIVKIKLDNFLIVKEQGLNKSFDDWSKFDLSNEDIEIKDYIDSLIKENEDLISINKALTNENLIANNFIDEKKELSNEKELEEIVKIKKIQNNRFNAYLEDHVKSMINEELKTRSNEYAKEINNRASKLFYEFTKGKYSMIIKENILIKDNIDNKELKFEELSKGTQIQLILATRIAMIEQQEEKLNIKLPIFLDEVTENSDFERTQEIINTLSNLKDRQIFCFSPKKFAKEEWKTLGEDKVNIIELA